MLYLQQARYKASPKAISGRTSYLRVRLEFLPYPQLIATLFNGCAFGPPLPFTATSTWTWVDHPVSGLRCLTIFALLRLGFPSAPDLKSLTSPVPATRRTVLQKVRGCTMAANCSRCFLELDASPSLIDLASLGLFRDGCVLAKM